MSESAADDPGREYRRRQERCSAELIRFDGWDGRIATARGLCFFAGVLILIAASLEKLSPGWAILPFALFGVLIVLHGPIIDRRDAAARRVRHYRDGLERLAGRWAGAGCPGERYADASHPYSSDLDLFGRGSLFELLCQARTRLGEDVLAEWLSHAGDVPTIRSRQAAVAELRGALDLREQLATLDVASHEDFDQGRLIPWVAEPAQPLGAGSRLLATLLASACAIALGGMVWPGWGVAPFLIVLLIEFLFLATLGRTLHRLAQTASDAASGLAVLAKVLGVLECETFQSDLLVSMRRRLDTQGLPPSRQIARLDRVVRSLDNAMRNQFFALIAAMLCLHVHLIHAIEVWRRDVGEQIPDWLRTVGEFETLLSLSGFAFEHPRYVVPQLREDACLFDATQIGHPLLPDGTCISNDLRLGDPTRLILISGSNMSGKSTMLRTVGINLVLAFAGGPARAGSLATSLFQIGTAMRNQDSLQTGESLFFAAVSRLKSVVDRADRSPTLLFLFDEILQGTNSHDRLIGSEGVIRALVERGAVGLVTTHDLALTEIANRLGARAANMHFEDSLVDGRMTFDYRIRPGVVRKSNALELMKIVGLNVDE